MGQTVPALCEECDPENGLRLHPGKLEDRLAEAAKRLDHYLNQPGCTTVAVHKYTLRECRDAIEAARQRIESHNDQV